MGGRKHVCPQIPRAHVGVCAGLQQSSLAREEAETMESHHPPLLWRRQLLGQCAGRPRWILLRLGGRLWSRCSHSLQPAVFVLTLHPPCVHVYTNTSFSVRTPVILD